MSLSKWRNILSISIVCVSPLVGSKSFAAPSKAETPSASVIEQVKQCRDIFDDSRRLACFDKATAAFVVAEKRGDVVVADREQIAQARKKSFGLKMPDLLPFRNTGPKGAAPITQMDFEIASSTRSSSGRMTFVATTGEVWRETEDRDLPDDPIKGSKLAVRRGLTGNYFCTPERGFTVSCARVK